MHKQLSHQFMTLVLSAVVSTILVVISPTISLGAVGGGELELDPSVGVSTDTQNDDVLNGIQVSPAPKPEAFDASEPADYFYRYKHALSARVGGHYNSDYYTEKKNLLVLLGIQYLTFFESTGFLEGGFDLLNEGDARVHLAKRCISSTARYRPYTKAGFGIELVGDEGLATIFEFDNWQLRGALGFEYLLAAPLSLRSEVELGIGFKAAESTISAGLAWAW